MNAQDTLKYYFGYESFKKGQESIIHAILNRQDVLAIMPTGAGKSICFQVPAMMLPGMTLVVSPLISLMQDQVKALNEAGIQAAYINSSLSENQITKALKLASEGRYKIMYVAPERLESETFIEFSKRIPISMVTVDEAHCISQWGQDFRPSYQKIVGFIQTLPNRPILSAFTATATEEVKEDILCILNLKNPNIVITGFDRENLYYQVESIKNKDDYILQYIQKHPKDSGIIYCSTRKNVDALYDLLVEQNIAVARYHAGMNSQSRIKSQNDFIFDRTPIIVATNAFGMGIDKSNVRFVIHYNMPQSIENYYQEAGRAGRDGQPSECILLYALQDIFINKFLLEHKDFTNIDNEDVDLIQQRDMKRLQAMEGYCKTTKCLRNYILQYFGEKTGAPCDHCGNCDRNYQEVDMTEQAKQVINCLAETKGRYGLVVVLGTLLGANRARLKEIGATQYRTYGKLKEESEDTLRALISQMILEGYIVQSSDQYSVLRMGDYSPLKANKHVIVRLYEPKEVSKKQKAGSKDTLTRDGYNLFEKLKELRLTIAREESVPPYIIFSDKTLIDMCIKVPEHRNEMLKVSGMGQVKFDKYGIRFLEAIQEFKNQNSNAITYIMDESSIVGKEKKSKKKKEEFYLNPEDVNQFMYKELYYMTEIKEQLNRITSAENVKKVIGKQMFHYLEAQGLVKEYEKDGLNIQEPTEKGKQIGITVIEKESKMGKKYNVLLYPIEVQKLLIDFFVRN